MYGTLARSLEQDSMSGMPKLYRLNLSLIQAGTCIWKLGKYLSGTLWHMVDLSVALCHN